MRAKGKVTSDFIVDILEEFWKSESWRFPQIKTLLINQDNGGENNSRRTQFMKRIVEFSQSNQLNIRLVSQRVAGVPPVVATGEPVRAYYPPYHSKYCTVTFYLSLCQINVIEGMKLELSGVQPRSSTGNL